MRKKITTSVWALFVIFAFAYSFNSVSREGDTFFGVKSQKVSKLTTHVVEQKGFLLTDEGKIALEIADTEGERVRGLSGRKSLASGAGMLFVFPADGLYGFWMKDMSFSIDIIWIDRDFRVVHIEEGVSPSTYPNTFKTDVDARYVLELNAGKAESLGIEIGKLLSFENIF